MFNKQLKRWPLPFYKGYADIKHIGINVGYIYTPKIVFWELKLITCWKSSNIVGNQVINVQN